MKVIADRAEYGRIGGVLAAVLPAGATGPPLLLEVVAEDGQCVAGPRQDVPGDGDHRAAGVCGQCHAEAGEGLGGFFRVDSAGEIVGGVVDSVIEQTLAQCGDQSADRFQR